MSGPDAVHPAETHPRERRRSLLFDGWTQALAQGVLALAAVAAVAVALALGITAGGLLPGTSPATALREGGLLFFAFHHVGIQVASPSLALPGHVDALIGLPSGYQIDATVSVALMGGTLLAAWLLLRGGRAVARSTHGSPLLRGLQGSKVGLVYASASWAFSWALSFEPRFPHTSPMAVHPSHISAFFWPLVIGMAAGFFGGVRSAPQTVWSSDWWAGEDWNRRWPGILAGAVRMTLLGLGLAVVSLLVLGAFHPDATAAYFRTVFAGAPLAGVTLVALTLLSLPNLALWLLIPAMGGCLEVSGSAVYQPTCFLGYGSYVGHVLPGLPGPSGFPMLGPAPPELYALLVVPLVAVVLGGVRAARRAEVRTGAEGALAGALAGLAFAVVLGLLAALALVVARFNGPFYVVSTGSIRYGSSAGSAFQLGLFWGVLGGAGGGWLAGARRASRT